MSTGTKRLTDGKKEHSHKKVPVVLAKTEYGKGDDTCGMVGYVQSMEFDGILQEINLAINKNPEPISSLSSPVSGWQEKGASELEHQLERSFPISPFRMHHFWVDLR